MICLENIFAHQKKESYVWCLTKANCGARWHNKKVSPLHEIVVMILTLLVQAYLLDGVDLI